mmetsp:Transcript_13413/g.42100  ORF Transcript_13413/g.42100 Transcript_13413/m.42100 type:complete len:214 (-) Transcript_13413:9-650(-)
MGCMPPRRYASHMARTLPSCAAARAPSSALSAATCVALGTSPVSSSHSSPSGRGSPLGVAAGRLACRSSMVCPRKRMPSSSSSRLVSHSIPLMPRMPPMAMPSVTSPSTLLPCCALSALSRSRSPGTFASIAARRPEASSPEAAGAPAKALKGAVHATSSGTADKKSAGGAAAVAVATAAVVARRPLARVASRRATRSAIGRLGSANAAARVQ